MTLATDRSIDREGELVLKYEAVVTFQSLDLESAERAAELCRIYIAAFEAGRPPLPSWVGEITTRAEVREYDDEDIDTIIRVVPGPDFYGTSP